MTDTTSTTDTVWVAVDDFGDGVPSGGPFESFAQCEEWIGYDERFMSREMPRAEAMAALARTRRLANARYESAAVVAEIRADLRL